MRIGTRRSPLAIAQAEEVGAALLGAHGIEVELVPMTTSGDEGAAPTAGRRDSRVCGSTRSSTHWKPVRSTWRCTRRRTCPPRTDDGFMIAAVPLRADPCDVLICRDPGALAPAP